MGFALAKADTKAGREPPKRFSTTSSASAALTASLLTSEVMTLFSFLSTPRSASRFMTVYAVEFFQPSLSRQAAANSPLLTGSSSQRIQQNRYSLSNIFGTSITFPSI